MKTKAPIQFLKLSLAATLILGLTSIGHFATAQSLNSAKQKQESAEKVIKKEAVEAEKAETAKPNLQSAPAVQKPAKTEEHMRQEKMRKEADAAKVKAEPAKSDVQKKADKARSQSEEAVTTPQEKGKVQKELGTKSHTGTPADEIAKKKEELELRKQHGKITEEEYQAAIKELEAKSSKLPKPAGKPRPAEKPKSGTPDKK